jgi:uncharacterized cofD-like protein
MSLQNRGERSVAVIGGGNGAYRTLKALHNNGDFLHAIITTLDNGGSTGPLRTRFGIPAMGDVRRALCALADNKELVSLFGVRFTHDELCDSGLDGETGHSFGNLALAALFKDRGTFEAAVDAASKMLCVRGEVLPVTNEPGHLRAIRSDGKVINGETNIDIPKDDKGHLRIINLEIVPKVKGNPKAVASLLRARKIVVGPGDLFTSILPCLIVPEIRDAYVHSSAEKIFVANIMTKNGETPGYDIDDFVEEIAKYLRIQKDKVFDKIIMNSSALPDWLLHRYAKAGAHPVRVSANSTLLDKIAHFPLHEKGEGYAYHGIDLLREALSCVCRAKVLHSPKLRLATTV